MRTKDDASALETLHNLNFELRNIKLEALNVCDVPQDRGHFIGMHIGAYIKKKFRHFKHRTNPLG